MLLSWFLTAHILVYTSVKTCRHSSPHLWWLVFSILCITYLMILEVIILGLVVFIIGPIIIVSGSGLKIKTPQRTYTTYTQLLWNIFLICIGRHPIQNPHMIKPEIGKLPKSAVDRIPLVMYIPPPPDAPPVEGPITIPDAAYSYPPKNPPPTPARPKRRFRFIGKFSKANRKEGSADGTSKTGAKDEKTKADDEDSWEAHWEKDGYPFVVLENNRAACAICLMDFEEPKRIKRGNEPADTQDTLVEPASKTESSPAATESTTESITEEQRERDASNLKLEHAGDGAQPLRLLTCGHVFHVFGSLLLPRASIDKLLTQKTCLDPWLTDVSGRCPVCQRPVELPEPSKKKRSRRQ
ncbi:hypothetical protein AAF712_000140 [Marasmius tenuissimus]|uniref:RING-type domain-containing protein n=1 Tax=Marasmius tenuissimus TaxID=585030 RepID=A0ABR3AEM4_9AGAR